MKKILSKLLSGTLAALFVCQVMIYGDGSAQGIAHAETIAGIKESLQLSKNADELAQEFDSAVEGLGEIDYFDVNLNKSKVKSKAQSKSASGLNITGYVSQYGTYSDLSKVKIIGIWRRKPMQMQTVHSAYRQEDSERQLM